MTNEEKSKEYPVILNEYNYEWQKTFQEEKKHLLSIVGQMVENIFHFGSTAIPEMVAKPTVDILVIMKANVDVDLFLNLMVKSQYLCTKYPDLSKKRNNCMNFVRPYQGNEIQQ